MSSGSGSGSDILIRREMIVKNGNVYARITPSTTPENNFPGAVVAETFLVTPGEYPIYNNTPIEMVFDDGDSPYTADDLSSYAGASNISVGPMRRLTIDGENKWPLGFNIAFNLSAGMYSATSIAIGDPAPPPMGFYSWGQITGEVNGLALSADTGDVVVGETTIVRNPVNADDTIPLAIRDGGAFSMPFGELSAGDVRLTGLTTPYSNPARTIPINKSVSLRALAFKSRSRKSRVVWIGERQTFTVATPAPVPIYNLSGGLITNSGAPNGTFSAIPFIVFDIALDPTAGFEAARINSCLPWFACVTDVTGNLVTGYDNGFGTLIATFVQNGGSGSDAGGINDGMENLASGTGFGTGIETGLYNTSRGSLVSSEPWAAQLTVLDSGGDITPAVGIYSFQGTVTITPITAPCNLKIPTWTPPVYYSDICFGAGSGSGGATCSPFAEFLGDGGTFKSDFDGMLYAIFNDTQNAFFDNSGSFGMNWSDGVTTTSYTIQANNSGGVPIPISAGVTYSYNASGSCRYFPTGSTVVGPNGDPSLDTSYAQWTFAPLCPFGALVGLFVCPSGSGSGGTLIIAIDCGGVGDGAYAADEYFVDGAPGDDGATFSVSNAIDASAVTNPAPQEVYQTERFGNFGYNIPTGLPSTSCHVRLHFSENFWGAAGQRVFNMSINSIVVLTNFDIFATTGAQFKAVVEEFDITTDGAGRLSLRCGNVTDFAKIDGIEVYTN